ncbi:hypothetical protein POSPLADRAFT_1055234 [Postia placenta MAD-698-R-SB12]|uniref:Uncharacterized protein n=1 Tax=Postia placenta MAD-698-R-SB12 TaxID=670580 RepID=A0A1X6N3I7_9APHY|nr:hypothetical protein POSPLADRAFT_1055234 [Postia placenta MAD-698-R-SB12]OSX63168.1 hypothetical protein POSPLADRAFT_1055234 [Postia placenta MAD-698-R-SB12]
MTSWQQHDTQIQSMDNSTEPCKHYESFGEVDEEDVGWIADACDDLAENMDSGTVPYYLTENAHHPMTREDLIEDGLGYNTSIFASCADTDNVSTALAPGLHMADQNATTNEYDAHTDGEEDLFNEQDREVGTIVAACPPAPRHTANGMTDKEMSSIQNDRTGEGYVDVRTNVWPPARSPQPAQISDALVARDASVLCATTTTSIERGRPPLPLPGTSSAPVIPSTTTVLEEEQEHHSHSRQGLKRRRDDDADEDNDEMAHVKTTTSAEPTQERRANRERTEPTVVPHECPVDTLGQDVALQLEASLKVESSNGVACAASTRLWEALLENHRVPYLLLRVADMRFELGSQVTALDSFNL